MKMRLTPIEINLRDLPPEGRTFTYTRETGEMNKALEDLIEDRDYQVQLEIMPAGNSFNLHGTVKTAMGLQCSLCALDFSHPVNLKLNELLVPQKPMAKGDHMAKANHAHEWESEGPDYILMENDIFKAAEYVHEMIALTEPIRPLGKPDCDLGCENITEPMRKYLAKAADAGEKGVNSSPFRVLEKMKLKS